MINFKQILLGAIVFVGTTMSYGQPSDANKARVDGRNVYMGYDQAKNLAAQQKDTTFVRYFAGNFEVNSLEAWTNKIVYKGHKESDKLYTFNSYNYVKESNSDELKLRKEWINTYTIKQVKNIKSHSKEYLLDGLVEEVTYEGKEKRAKCIDIEGKILNEKGCLRYTITPLKEKDYLALRVSIVDATRKVTGRNRGLLPKYRLTNVVADYETKSWKVYQEFPADFDKSSKMYTKLLNAVDEAVKKEKLDEVFFNQDINGNYYNTIFFINGIYN